MSRRRITVLVVENNPARASLLRSMLAGRVVDVVTCYLDAVRALSFGPVYDEIWLDHDLDDRCHNGQDVAFWMTLMPKRRRPASVFIHAANCAGALGIYYTLREGGFDPGMRGPPR